MGSFKDLTTRQINKLVGQKREQQRKIRRGRHSRVRATRISKDTGYDLYYMIDRDDVKIAKRERGGVKNV